MTSSSVLWAVHVPSVGYLYLALALLVHSSRQSHIVDLGYSDVRDLGHNDVRQVDYSDVRDRQLHGGSRIKRLLKISKRLDSGSQAAQIESETKLSQKAVEVLAREVTQLLEALVEEPMVEALVDQPRQGGGYKEWEQRTGKRGSDTEAAAEVRTKFSIFYESLQDFAAQLPSRLKPDAPSGFHDVDVLTRIMTPNDHVFSDGDVQLFTYKYFTIHELMTEVMKHIPQFLESEEDTTNWYWDNFMYLNTNKSIVDTALQQWQTDATDSSPGVIVMDAGVGGVNSGVRNDLNQQDIEKLGNLINTLNELINAS